MLKYIFLFMCVCVREFIALSLALFINNKKKEKFIKTKKAVFFEYYLLKKN